MKDPLYRARRQRLNRKPAAGTARIGQPVQRDVAAWCDSLLGHALYQLEGDLIGCVRCGRLFVGKAWLANADTWTLERLTKYHKEINNG